MQQRIIRYLWMAGLIISICACEFSPSDIPYTELEQPSEENMPPIWIDLKPEMDTLRISTPIWITFSAETSQNQIYTIQVQLDDEELGSVNYDTHNRVKAYINTGALAEGIHELKITTYTATNSGSIADKTGIEAYWYELRWPVYVNKNAKANYSLKEPEPISEGIKISWPKYDYADFKQYVFSWKYNGVTNGGITITNPYLNSCIDRSYVEGIYATYSVSTHYLEGNSNGADIVYHEKIKDPTVKINEDCTVDITWERSKNVSQIKCYCLKTSVPVYSIPEEHDLEDFTQTTLRLKEKIGFGADYQVQLRYIPTWHDSYHSALNTGGGITRFSLGDSIPCFQRAFLVTDEKSHILYHKGIFKKYDLQSNEITGNVSIPATEDIYLWTVAGSPDGIYFGHFSNKQYVIRRSSDLSIVNTIDLPAYNDYNFILRSISLSNNGLVGMTDINNNLKIFDTSTGQKIFEKSFDGMYVLVKVILSPDGKNIALKYNDYGKGTTSLGYYSFDGNKINEIGIIDNIDHDAFEILTFSPASNYKIAIAPWRGINQYNVEVRDSRTFELLNLVEIPRGFVPVSFDFATDRVIAQYRFLPSRRYSYLIETTTGKQNSIVQFNGHEPLLFNEGEVFAGNGRKINIDNFIIE